MPKPKKDAIEVDGVVIDALPNATFVVKLDEGGHEVIAHISGKLRIHNIRVIKGDRVCVELSPYDLRHGRIRTRYR